MTETSAQASSFLTDFSPGKEESPSAPTKSKYSAEEVAEIRQQAFLEGQQSVEARAAEDLALTVGTISGHVEQLAAQLNSAAFEHKKQATELALAIAKKAAMRALENYPEGTIEQIAADILELVPSNASVLLTVPEGLVEAIKARFENSPSQTVSDTLSIKPNAEHGTAACELSWKSENGEHGASMFEPEELLEKIEELVVDRLWAEEPQEGQLDLFSPPPDAT